MRAVMSVFLLAGLLAITGCMDGARLVRVTDDGGIVSYPLKREGETIYSPFRPEALRLIEGQCRGSYRIVREGETKGTTRNSGLDADDLITTRRFWGLQFRCTS
jgi:hypothetical protein